MTYLVNGVDLYDSDHVVLVKGTVWRPDVSTVRSPVAIAGRHGSIDRGLPVFGEPKLTLVVDLDADDSPADLEAAGNAVIGLLTAPQLIITRVSGGLVTSVEARLESISHSNFLWSRTATITAVFALPSVFWREDVQTSTPVVLTGSAADVTVAHLAGSTAPARGAVLRVTGPATSVAINEAVTGTGLSWAGSGLVAGQYLFIDVDRLRAWRSASSSQWTPGGTDVSGGLDYPAGGRLQLWPRVAPVKTVLATNLATNGSFEATSGTVEVRRNHYTSPRATGSWGGNAGTGGSATFTTETDARFKGGTARRGVWTVAPSNNSAYISAGPMTTGTKMAVGETWVLAMRYAVTAGYVGGAVSLQSGGTNAPSGTYGTQQSIDHGDGTITVWRTFTIGSLNAGDGSYVPFLQLPTFAALAGADVRIGDAYAFRGADVFLGYNDGGYSPDLDLTPSWAGSVNASESVLTGAGLPLWAVGGGGRAAVSSSHWASTGTKSLRVIPTTTSNDIPMRVAGADNSLTGLGVTFVPGQTYTVLVRCRMVAPQTGTIHAVRARRVGVNYGAGSLTSFYGPQAPNEAGEHELRYTFTLPANVDRCVVILHGGASAGNGDVWWDDLTIVDGVYTGPPFDGSRRPAGYGSEWVGTQDNSQSLLYRSNPSLTTRAVVLSASAAGASGATALAVQAGRCFL